MTANKVLTDAESECTRGTDGRILASALNLGASRAAYPQGTFGSWLDSC